MKLIKKEIKYFLVFFSKRITNTIKNRYKSNGILFPDITIAIKKIKNKIGIINFIIDLLSFTKNMGNKKKEKIENRCIYPPAINSSPNGPEKFRPILGKPNMSFPNIN